VNFRSAGTLTSKQYWYEILESRRRHDRISRTSTFFTLIGLTVCLLLVVYACSTDSPTATDISQDTSQSAPGLRLTAEGDIETAGSPEYSGGTIVNTLSQAFTELRQ